MFAGNHRKNYALSCSGDVDIKVIVTAQKRSFIDLNDNQSVAK